jgi:carbon-monoxide dehydrogenase medium subunit
MKPPPFAYSAPRSVAEALDVLGREEEAKVLAGGQSLIPMLNMRLVAPAHLVDINRVAELCYISVGEDDVVVGALARHAEVEAHEAAASALPLLRQALRLVAHPVIRNRGTICGSIAHADPAGEMTAVVSLLSGTITAARASGTREIAARDFFAGPLETNLRSGELVISVRFPRLPPNTGTAFHEIARRHGDYALAGAAAAVSVDDDLRVGAAKVAYISLSPTPLVIDLTDDLVGQMQPTADWQAAARRAAACTEPEPDIHASAEYRRHLATVLTARALSEAARRAVAEATRGRQR